MTDTMNDRTAAIRDLNDRFRKRDASIPGKILITTGIQDLLAGDDQRTKALFEAIANHDQFDGGNDPYGEHDFGAFDFDGSKVFWKIDAYAPDLMHGSEDPADLAKTIRVLTIMLAEEY